MASVTKAPETTFLDLGSLLDADAGAIVTLMAGDTRLAAHRAVLAAGSPVMAAMFCHDMLEASSGVVSIPDVEGPVLRQLLVYIYTVRAPQLPEMAPLMLAAADKYGMSSLKAHCELQLSAQLAIENAAATAVLAVRHSCPSLTEAAVSFIKAHDYRVMATQGWADAVRCQPEDVVEVSRLLAEPTTGTKWHHGTVPKVEESTTGDLGSMLDADDGAIVTLVAGDTRLVIHRAVLAAGSSVLAAMCNHDKLEASGGLISIPDVEGKVLRQLLVFLYTQRAPQLPGMAPQLLAAAAKYGVTSLKAQCELQLLSQLTVENAAATAVLAVRHSCFSLRQAAISFIKGQDFRVMATKGWAEAVRSQPEAIVEVCRLLADPRSGCSTEASASCSSTSVTHHQSHRDRSRSPIRDEPPTSACNTRPLDGAVSSRMRNLSPGKKNKRLIEAAEEGAYHKVRMLLAAGAYAGARGVSRETALHFAAMRGDVAMARLLLDNGASVNTKDRCRNTALHWAAEHGHAAMVGLLSEFFADINAKGYELMTPLHYAARCGHVETVTALLEAGADRWARTGSRETPLDLAEKHNRQQVIEILR